MRGVCLSVLLGLLCVASASGAIDRQAWVSRHNPVLTSIDYESPLTVGNGGFAFTVDVTGLQTFPERYHRKGIPLETLSRWCWVEDANPNGFKLADANRDFTLPDGRIQGFPTNASSPAGEWLRRNPRNHPMGVIGLDWAKSDGTPFVPEDVKELRQTLDLWRGTVTSHYILGGESVDVTTLVNPRSDRVAVSVRSTLVAHGKLRVKLSFPRGHDVAVKNTPGFDWTHPESHHSTLVEPGTIRRTVGEMHYMVATDRHLERAGAHEFFVMADPGRDELACTVAFSPGDPAPIQTFSDVLATNAAAWPAFWRKAAALDLTGSANPLAQKLEERVVLSQYLTAVQMAGEVPPQESGLTCSTWYGKHHTEMIWWHAAHFALWNHPELLAKNLRWYQSHLPEARALAKSRGLRGARWPKMVGPDARESPGGNPLIVWNQPHLIYLCELLYRSNPSRDTLEKYRDLVLETAECLASMTWLDPERGQYVLGPPLWIVQEIYDPATSQNPAFELSYWRWTLQLAQTWRERLGLPREAHWDDVIGKLAKPPVKDGKYVALESHSDTWENLASRHDHPEMLMALGMLPGGPDIDRATMGRTLDAVLKEWDWQTKIWGWDYPMIAMTATRLGRPEVAMDVLLRDGPNNHYTRAGHCPQRSDTALPKDAPVGARRSEIAVYLPANGAFLSAVALMVAGWDGCEEKNPGFAKDGSWHIEAEGWSRLP